MLDFPTNPGVGDQYSIGTRTWFFNGQGWARIGDAGQVSRSFYLVSPLVQVVCESLPVEVTNDFYLLNYI